jgi:pimeloyl-ACP methyl ester carboxylesterase
MGEWMAMLLAKHRPERVKALVLIAPAADFPTKLLWPNLGQQERAALIDDGVWYRPSEYDENPYPVTMDFITESRNHNLLDGECFEFEGPLRILHGDQDELVPYSHGLKAAQAVTSEDVLTTIIKGGDHRLSSEAHLNLLTKQLDALSHI